MPEPEEFTIRPSNDGCWKVYSPYDSLVAVCGNREDADLVVSIPELCCKCQTRSDRTLSFAKCLEEVLSLCVNRNNMVALRLMRQTADDIKSEHSGHEK